VDEGGASRTVAKRVLLGFFEASTWISLSLLALLGLWDEAVTLGIWLLVLPGLLLLLAPNLLIYAIPLRLGIGVGLRLGYPLGVAVTLGVGAVIALGAPLIVNARLTAEALQYEGSDFGHLDASTAKPRTIELDLERGEGCFEVCRTLLVRGIAERVVAPLPLNRDKAPSKLKAVFRLADAEICRQGAWEDGANDKIGAAGCILRSVEPRPDIDVSLRISPLVGAEREVETRAKRLDPLAPGRQSVEVLELLTCAEGGVCTETLRRTYVHQERLFAPLLLGAEESSLHLYRAWARIGHGAKADPVKFLASQWPATRPMPPDAVTDQLPIVFDISGLVANPDQDERGMTVAQRHIAEGSGPLTPVEKALLWSLFDKPYAYTLEPDIGRRPEALDVVKARLGDALMAQRGKESGALWAVQALIADLPDKDFQRLRPTLMRWLKDPEPVAIGDNNPLFLIRLSDLGPGIAVPLAEGVLSWPAPGYYAVSQDEIAGAEVALCLVGSRQALPVLRKRLDRPKENRDDKALATVIDRIEGRTSKSACLGLFSSRSDREKAWLERFAEDRGLKPLA
jgi:hypothetical protein